MLRDVYLHVGLGWTVLIGGLVMLTALSWLVAMAGAVTRPMSGGRRALLLAVLTVLPPSAIVVLMRFVAATQGELRSHRALDGASGSSRSPEILLLGPNRRAA